MGCILSDEDNEHGINGLAALSKTSKNKFKFGSPDPSQKVEMFYVSATHYKK
jgi:hypothetical protein